MHCKNAISEESLHKNTDDVWRNTIYTAYRMQLLFEKEQARFPEDQIYAENYLSAKSELRNLAHSKYKINYFVKIIQAFGKVDSASASVAVKRRYIKRCINVVCKGFLDESFKCGLCLIAVCTDCHDELRQGHLCKPELVASIKAIRQEARPCPSCAILISKIDGCDQMWCTQCHVTYSWNSGQVEKGLTHNPHYYEWARKNGGLARHPEDLDVRCNGLPSYRSIISVFSDEAKSAKRGSSFNEMSEKTDDASSLQILTEIYRYVNHIKVYLVDTVALEPRDNFAWRIRYMANEMDIERFKLLLDQQDKQYRKCLAGYHVYNMIYQASGDLFRNLITSRAPLNVREEFKNLFAYGNRCLINLEDTYRCSYEKLMVHCS
jgi:hypothetical protein